MARRRKTTPESEAHRKAVTRAQERRRDHNAAVRQMLEQALTAPRQRPDMDELLARLDHVYELAIRLDPPALGAAVQSVLASAKLLGLVIERQVSVVGTPEEFRAESREAIYESVRERLGSYHADRFRKFVEHMDDDGEILDVEPSEDDDGA